MKPSKEQIEETAKHLYENVHGLDQLTPKQKEDIWKDLLSIAELVLNWESEFMLVEDFGALSDEKVK